MSGTQAANWHLTIHSTQPLIYPARVSAPNSLQTPRRVWTMPAMAACQQRAPSACLSSRTEPSAAFRLAGPCRQGLSRRPIVVVRAEKPGTQEKQPQTPEKVGEWAAVQDGRPGV